MELTFALKKSPDFIFDYLTDMDKFARVHPVITKIDKVGANQYLVHETLKLGFIPYSFTYPVSIESDHTQKTVVIKATVMKMTRIEMNFAMRATGDISVVDETICIKTFLPIKGLIRKIFREQHEKLFKSIEEL